MCTHRLYTDLLQKLKFGCVHGIMALLAKGLKVVDSESGDEESNDQQICNV